MQPAPQSMGSFPTSHGKTASFFQSTGVQQEFAFIPDDGSSTFVVNVEVSFSLCVSSLILYPKCRNFVFDDYLEKHYQDAYWSCKRSIRYI